MQRSFAPRHELKYFVSLTEAARLSRVLSGLFERDAHADARGEYLIRSLYFDDLYDRAYRDKQDGVPDRDKYRLRIYGLRDAEIFLERKRKIGDLIQKDSARVTRALAQRLMEGDPAGLERARSQVLRDLFIDMRLKQLRPRVVVDYAREAYQHPAGNTRVTFDKRVRTALYARDLFDPALPTVPVMDQSACVMEVKFDGGFPSLLSALLSGAKCDRMAVSKYVLCREHEKI